MSRFFEFTRESGEPLQNLVRRLSSKAGGLNGLRSTKISFVSTRFRARLAYIAEGLTEPRHV